FQSQERRYVRLREFYLVADPQEMKRAVIAVARPSDAWTPRDKHTGDGRRGISGALSADTQPANQRFADRRVLTTRTFPMRCSSGLPPIGPRLSRNSRNPFPEPKISIGSQ